SSVSVTEGDSVTLHNDITECKDCKIVWAFGEDSLIAKINREKLIFSTFDVHDGRFRNRLKLDDMTGSLTIMNITTQHAGLYQLNVFGAEHSSKVFSVTVYGEYRMVSVMEGDSVTLNTDVTEIQENYNIVWKFGRENVLITTTKRKKHISRYDVPDERFRDRLKLDNQTGSLTITNITTQLAGLYKIEIRGAKLISKTFNITDTLSNYLSVLLFILSCFQLVCLFLSLAVTLHNALHHHHHHHSRIVHCSVQW
uniref:Immunoglobulin domain-containing protein n=1 Tax=Sinocyclocheilus rhinocerous TaxID=307959 RepID=A0A673GKQ9_9TELE